ncbi:radical SAM protein [Anaerotruncus colihominis]|uniref:radical SAM protein n=1 Tax=Anaerotruncus colihominis TaxID=169435 RepID=UPI001A9C115D|nr:radical SAM protein [Anaerotruncus colihominis]
MSCKCGSQITLCNLPIRFDTYTGCSHGCRYCFVQKKNGQLEAVKKGDDAKALKAFIDGKRTGETRWCDWNIPVHWGGMSDPFQPIEKKYGYSLECLKLLAETHYPFVVSTKGQLLAADEYLDLLSRCNCVVQISMVCSKYDQLERGAPPFEERLEILRKVSPRVKRTIVRIQPYMPEVFREVMANIPRIAEAGAHGIVVEGMKFAKKKPGLVRIGGDSVYPIEILRRDFEQIKTEAHRHGLKFYSGENRLRNMGDDMTCCGIEGLEGFRPNTYNICMMINGKNPQPTELMKTIGTAEAFKTLDQNAGSGQKIAKQSLAGIMQRELAQKTDYYKKIFGKADHE